MNIEINVRRRRGFKNKLQQFSGQTDRQPSRQTDKQTYAQESVHFTGGQNLHHAEAKNIIFLEDFFSVNLNSNLLFHKYYSLVCDVLAINAAKKMNELRHK